MGPLMPIPPFYTGTLRKLPTWAKHGAVFGLEGRLFRIVTTGSHNNTPERARWEHMTEDEKRDRDMFVEIARAVPVQEVEPRMPDAPCEKWEVANALRAIGELRVFTPEDLERAIVAL